MIQLPLRLQEQQDGASMEVEASDLDALWFFAIYTLDRKTVH